MAPRCSSFVVLCLLYQYCVGSKLVFQAHPDVVHPVLTKTLELRCSVDSGVLDHGTIQTAPPLVGKRKTHMPLDFLPALIYSGTSTQSSVHRAQPSTTISTTAPQSSPTTASYTTTTPPQNIEASHVMSIIISRQDPGTGQLETVASVSPYDSAALTSAAGGDARVTGNTETSPVSGEQGYLSVVWDHPLMEQTGSYVCQVSALDSNLLPVTVTGSVAVTMLDPAVEDLVKYIVDNDKYISQLQDTVSQLQNQVDGLQQTTQLELQELQNKTANMSAQNIQTGSLAQCNSGYSQQVTFPIPYESTPMVFFSVNVVSDSGTYGSSYSIQLQSVNETGFTATCSASSVTFTAEWLSIDV